MIADFHSHIGTDYYSVNIQKKPECSQSSKELIKKMRRYHVDLSVVFPFPSTRYLVCDNDNCKRVNPLKLYKQTNEEMELRCPDCGRIYLINVDPYYSANKDLLDTVKKYKILIPFISFDPRFPDTSYFEELIPHCFGIKLHTFVCGFSIDNLTKTPYFELLEKFNLPLVIHSGQDEFSKPENCIRLSDNYRGKIIVAHGGRLFKDFLIQAKNRKNVYIDTSPMTYLFKDRNNPKKSLLTKEDSIKITSLDDLIIYLVENVGIDSIVFGTDSPYCEIEGSSYGKEVDAILNCERISAKEKDRILFENFQTILKHL
jgi:predicted TIM-barrel fold metal-dependent hydrolase